MTHTKSIWSGTATTLLLTSLMLQLPGCGGTDNEAGQQPNPAPLATTPSVDSMNLARQALTRNDFDSADSHLKSLLLAEPTNLLALEMCSEVALRRGDPDAALALLDTVIAQSDSPTKATLSKAAEVATMCGKPYESIRFLVQLNEAAPQDIQPKYDLIGLSAVLGLPHLALPPLQWLAQRGKVDFESLQVLANPLRVQPDESFCKNSLKRCPDDLRAHFGLAQLESIELNWQAVLDRLKPVLEKHPDFAPAFSLYGRALVESGKYDLIPAWQKSLPQGIEDDAQYWVVAGLWAQDKGKPGAATYAFWQALKKDKTINPRASQGLASSLRQLGRTKEAEQVSQHLAAFAKMSDALKTHLDRDGESQEAAVAVAESMIPLGRIWEAEAWIRLAAPLPNDRVKDLRKRYQSIRSQLTLQTPWQLPANDLVTMIDPSGLPEVDWATGDGDEPTGRESAARFAQNSPAGKIRFANEADLRGLKHTCDLAPTKPNEGHWIYQTVGGGIAVIDYDLDGWPDLTAARLNGQPMQDDSSPNRLFRNQSGVFHDRSGKSNYHDTGFSHGFAIGDYNSDGFPDIYDANFGINRLYRNNGDGTFTDVTRQAGLKETLWTTSAAIADIDGDGLADIFETAYCIGQTSIDHACRDKSGKIMTCSPLLLPAQTDSVFSGTANGLFTTRSDAWLDQTSPGRGLGLILGQLNERPGLDIFVANDMTANHFWSGQKDASGFHLVDLGVLSGVAVSGLSLSQASMGMAAADPDGDGDIDFFITHFMDDHNTYYEQVRPGVWVDRSYQSGLSEPSTKLLGFGTEWIDFDNNGTVELIVANGHVDDFQRDDIPYKMPAQVFSLGAQGRWSEMDAKDLGKYFQELHVGRAIASLDVNHDGLTDVAVTHLEEPVALLINQSETSAKSTCLFFRSTTGQRDAIGTSVTATINNRSVSHQLLAGDGYMCSNERRITIGSGDAKQIDDVRVKWPSGTEESLGTISTGRDYLIVEGISGAFELSSHQPD